MGRSAELYVYGTDDDRPSELDELRDRLADAERRVKERAMDAADAAAHPDHWPAWRWVEPALMPQFTDRPYTFADFVREVGPRPPGAALTRKDVTLPYTAGNLRWAVRPPAPARPNPLPVDPPPPSPPPIPSPYLTYEEAAAHCKCAVKSLQNAKCRGELAAGPGGAGVRFTRAELDRWMLRRPSSRR